MPTSKPRIQAILDEEIYIKFKEICESEGRSESNLAKYIITKYINENTTTEKPKLLNSEKIS